MNMSCSSGNSSSSTSVTGNGLPTRALLRNLPQLNIPSLPNFDRAPQTPEEHRQLLVAVLDAAIAIAENDGLDHEEGDDEERLPQNNVPNGNTGEDDEDEPDQDHDTRRVTTSRSRPNTQNRRQDPANRGQ